MDPATAVIVSTVIAKLCPLLSIWIRSHWRARREQQRQRYLLQVAETVASDGQVELDDRDGDGHHLHVKITRTPVPGEDQAA
ncbi:hypothetical protein [Streptomyces prunicolor]|uniref:Uncharacterized protein n=1 Tax=Streptomyces prunicolor TaxID=67348 RepID=A0ABU4F778_9ACTN|nr:hypothetical protein [Streptomyces prunicolor]MCX5235345.1 hypothetical protein [Streptomyces prunicolor]MDV7215150.1 hypothetical protein [Streptomyces prunicolor]